MGVLDASKSFKLSFFYALARPWIRAFRQAGAFIDVPSGRFGRFIAISALINTGLSILPY